MSQEKRSTRPGWVLRTVDRLFSYDFFIAYAWRDGRDYAVELHRILTEQGYTCFLDSTDYRAGNDWKTVGEAVLGRTGTLVLVGTAGAIESEAVRREITIFGRSGRPIVPVDLEGSLADLPADHPFWAHVSQNVLRVDEPDPGAPSTDTIERIVSAKTGELVAARRLRAVTRVAWVVAGLALLAVAAGGFAWIQRNRALDSERQTLRRAAELDWRLAGNAQLDTGTQTPNPIRAARYLLQAARLSRSAGDSDRAEEAVAGAGNELRFLQWTLRHGERLDGVAIHPKEDRLLTYSIDGLVREWRISDGRELRHMNVEGAIQWARYTPDGRFLAIVHDKESMAMPPPEGIHADLLSVWDEETWTKIGTVDGAVGLEENRLAIDSSGSRILLPSGDGDLLRSFGSTAPGRRLPYYTRETFDGRTNKATFSPDGRTVAWRQDRMLRVLGADGKELRDRFPGVCFAFGFSPATCALYSFRSVGVTKLASNSLSSVAPGPLVGALASEDGARVLTWDQGGRARIFDLGSERFGPSFRLVSPSAFPKLPTALESFSVGTTVCSVIGGDSILEFNLAKGWTHLAKVSTEDPFVRSFVDGFEITRRGDDRFDYRALGQPGVSSVSYSQGISTTSMLPSSRAFVVSLTAGARVFGLSELGSAPEAAAMAHETAILGAKVLPDGKRAVTWSEDGLVRLWSVEDPKRKKADALAHLLRDSNTVFDPAGAKAASSPDRRWTFDDKGPQRAYRLSDRKGLTADVPIPEEIVTAAVFGPDSGSFVWMGYSKKLVHALNLTGRRPLETVLKDEEGVEDLAFDPKGRLLATLSSGKHLRVWSTRGGFRPVADLAHEKAITKIWFSADGRYVVSVDEVGTGRAWTTSTWGLVARLDIGNPVTVGFDPTGMRFVQTETREAWNILPPPRSIEDAVADFERRTGTKADPAPAPVP